VFSDSSPGSGGEIFVTSSPRHFVT